MTASQANKPNNIFPYNTLWILYYLWFISCSFLSLQSLISKKPMLTLCYRLVIRLFIYSVWKVYGGCRLILKLFCFSKKKYAIPWSNLKKKQNTNSNWRTFCCSKLKWSLKKRNALSLKTSNVWGTVTTESVLRRHSKYFWYLK